MKKLLVICGPTAVGKTKLALYLAKVLNGELLSADSRQVYKGMNIGTGKDLPVNSKIQIPKSKIGKQEVGYFDVDGVRIWGYDLVEVGEEFSVARYVKFANEIIKNILGKRRLPILVGGTGLYIKGVVDGIDTAQVPKNRSLRKSLEGKGASELFEILASFDPTKAASMNISDRHNPRRLVRAIEIAEYKIRRRVKRKVEKENIDTLFIGLSAPRQYLFKLIDERVKARLKTGLEDEIKKFTLKKVSWNTQAMSASGYRQWQGYFKGRETLEDVVKKWKRDEKSYAKRQITWFKRDKRIIWFDITKRGWQKSVEKLVKRWYSSKHNGFT